MAKFVPDIKTQRWIIVSQVRMARPDEHKRKRKTQVCPFCLGNEGLTPPELYRIGEGSENTPGWKVRVVPNKYPITDIHEVIIHGPDHTKDIVEFNLPRVITILKVYRSRYQAHMSNGQVMIFCNHGKHAGASLSHPHSQLVVIPRQINLDALIREPTINIIEDNHNFVTYCPDFSQWPYEVWVAPKKQGTIFADINDEEINGLAAILKRSLTRLKKIYSTSETQNVYGEIPFAYNYYIHHGKDWFIRIIPRLVHRAGFELGTGLSVNIIDPSSAAIELSKIKI